MAANHFTKSGNFYVSATGGNDSDAGTADAPFKTIAAGVAAAEAAGSGYSQTVVIGSGIYQERIVANNTSDYLVIQGDGNVIVDGTGQASSIYQGLLWHYYDITFVNAPWFFGGTASNAGTYTRCKFKNNGGIASVSMNANNKGNRLVWQDCVFENCETSNSSIYNRYCTYTNCYFINGRPDGTLSGAYTSNALSNSYTNCLFYVSSGSYSLTSYYIQSYGPAFTDCVFPPNTKASWGQPSVVAGFDLTQADIDGNIGMPGCKIASMSFNDNITGSGAFNLQSITMPLNSTTKELYSNQGIIKAFSGVGSYAPRTAYGEDASSANPLHTAGGATWANIITGSLGGFQISASTVPSGTITTAVIDQGSSKVVKSIGSAWATTAINAAAPSTYPSGALNYNPTRYQYEMRYGNSTPSGDYKLFEFDTTPYVVI